MSGAADWLSRSEVYGERSGFDFAKDVIPAREWMRGLRSLGSMPILSRAAFLASSQKRAGCSRVGLRGRWGRCLILSRT